MSFKTKLAIAFSSVLFLTIIVVMVNWWGMNAVIKKHDQVDTFTYSIEILFHRLIREDEMFRSSGTINHARAVNEVLAAIQNEFKNMRSAQPENDSSHSLDEVIEALTSYEKSFAVYYRSTITMQTMKSRMFRESQRLLEQAGELARQMIPGASASNDSSSTPPPDEVFPGFVTAQTAAEIQYLISTVLLAEKNFLLGDREDAANIIEAALAKIIDHANAITRKDTRNAYKLKAFRISRVAAIYRDIFTQFTAERKVLSTSESLMNRVQGSFSTLLSGYLSTERERTTKLILSLQFLSLAVSVMAIMLGITAVFILSNVITRPVNELKKSAREIVSGNLETSVTITSNDDIGELGTLFNQMTGWLKESFSRLENYKNHLEELVSERTDKLEKEISERRDTEEALRASSERLANIIDQSPLGIAIFDKDFHVREWNPSCEKIFSYRRREIIGKNVRMIVPENSSEQVRNVLRTLMKTRQSVRHRNENIRRDGQVIICDWYNTPLTDSSDRIIGMLSLVENVTEQIYLEKELLKVKKLESTGVLAGGIAHDFNNILTAILGNLNLSLHDAKLTAHTRKLLEASEKAATRAKTLTQQLLTFAKGGDPVKEQTSLVEVIRDSAEFVLHGSNSSCRYHFPDDLWLAEVDKGQISQVVQNIVLNASQSMPGGGIIDIRCENAAREKLRDELLPKDTDYLRITIADQGIGIPASTLERIFDPYFSTKKEGSGLGLAITLSIVTKHNGRISASSEPGSGTVFTIFLPATTGTAQFSKHVQKTVPSATPARILVMDDDKMVLDVIGSMLGVMGHTVHLSTDGDDCLRRYRELLQEDTPPDLVILDLTIPGGKGGEETARELLQIDPAARIIVSSGYSNDPIMASYKQYGFCAAISKPYVLREISTVIENTLKRSA